MTLIKSISGIRGTIGGSVGDNLTPVDIIDFVSAYAHILIKKNRKRKVVLGRDGRISGPQVHALTTQALVMMGIDVIDLGLSTTPTVEMSVPYHDAGGGVIITASHNPKEWNALKFLNEKGEFINAAEGEELLLKSKERTFLYAPVNQLGKVIFIKGSIDYHIREILKLSLVKRDLVAPKKMKVVVDCVNSTGAISIPLLLDALNCDYILINSDITGEFAHNPEPLEENLKGLSQEVMEHNADLGIAVDPDVDRLAFVDENGTYCGEEYTLVMVAQWVLENTPGPTVSNLSSTIVLRQITEKLKQTYYAAAVGEVNVVDKMKQVNAVIGGEGNGGIIYPELHYGRDALVGIALLITAICAKELTLSQYRSTFEDYVMTKNKIELSPNISVDHLLSNVRNEYSQNEVDTQDGVKIYFDEGWVHLRKSNTEPIIRLYAEAKTAIEAEQLTESIMTTITSLSNI